MFPDEDTLCLPSIGDGAAADRRLLLMHKIRGCRLLHGDERRYTTDSARQKAQEAGCPHGCACAYTWTHAFFFCTHDSLVTLRHQCRRALADLEVLDQGTHPQCVALRALFGEAKGRRLDIGQGEAFREGLARRACGGLWDANGNERLAAKAGEAQRALRPLLELAREAVELGRETEEAIQKDGRIRAIGRRLLKYLKRRVEQSTPMRRELTRAAARHSRWALGELALRATNGAIDGATAVLKRQEIARWSEDETGKIRKGHPWMSDGKRASKKGGVAPLLARNALWAMSWAWQRLRWQVVVVKGRRGDQAGFTSALGGHEYTEAEITMWASITDGEDIRGGRYPHGLSAAVEMEYEWEEPSGKGRRNRVQLQVHTVGLLDDMR